MSDEKLIVSKDMRDIMTSSDSNFVHISTFIMFLCKSCTIIIFAYLKFSHLKNYVRVVVVEFNSQRVFFHDVINFLSHNIIAKLLSLYIYKTFDSSLKISLWWWEIIINFISFVTCKFMQNRHVNRYFQSKRSLDSINARRFCTSHIIVNLHVIYVH